MENKQEANILPPSPGKYVQTIVNTNEPKPMAKPANMPKRSTFKYFILENRFVIDKRIDIRATIDFKT